MTPSPNTLAEKIETALRDYRVPGVAVAVMHGDHSHAQGFGVTSIDNPLPVTPDTLFQIGSITKPHLGTAAMRLVEQGRLDLDAPVASYIPEFRARDADAQTRVTMRHLLSHTAGWAGDYFNSFGWGDDALGIMVSKLHELPQLTPPGNVFHYNNFGFCVAGRVIEIVTGQPFEVAMAELVFEPLGMTNTWFFPEDVMVRRFAVGHAAYYDDTPTSVIPIWPIGRASHPAGGISSSVNDLLKFARLHMGMGDARALSPSSIAEMLRPQIEPCGNADAWGVTWAINRYGDTITFGHGGATNGFIAQFTCVPSEQFAFALLTNANRGRELTADVGAFILKEQLGLSKAEPSYISMDAEALGEYAGRYTAQLNELQLDVKDGALIVQAIPQGHFPTPETPPIGPVPPPFSLAFVNRDLAVVQDGPSKGSNVEFLRNEDGHIAWIRTGGRLHKPTR